MAHELGILFFMISQYNEGSCATIAAAWITGEKKCKMDGAYGDSVVHYSKETGVLEHSFTKLSDFSNPPRLVSCKDPGRGRFQLW